MSLGSDHARQQLCACVLHPLVVGPLVPLVDVNHEDSCHFRVHSVRYRTLSTTTVGHVIVVASGLLPAR